MAPYDAETPYPRCSELSVTLGSDFEWHTDTPFQVEWSPGDIETIWPGQTTDFVSARKWAEIVISTRDLKHARRAALVHDTDYRTGRVPRGNADRRFSLIMEADGVSWWGRNAMYLSVRIGGWTSYAGKD